MLNSKYSTAFKKLSKKAVFSAEEGRKAGLPSRMLAYFCKNNEIERVSRGVYKTKGEDFGKDFEWEDLALTALSIPDGVICLISALCYYDLTEEYMREFWIAVPHTTTAPKRENVHIMRMRNMSLGQTTITIGQEKLKIFDRERTVVDAFRLLDHELALKALKAYLKPNQNRKPDIPKLLSYAKLLRVNLKPYVLALIA